MIRYLCIGISLFFLTACGTKTTVVLLPDDDGTTGRVVVTSPSSSITLDKPYTYTEVKDDRSSLSLQATDTETVTKEFQSLLSAEPLKPVSFILYFNYNSTSLTDESMALIPEIIKTAREREPCEIDVIGHTDTRGEADYNYRLALERAGAVGEMLKTRDVAFKNLSIQSHGENNPLIITADNVSEDKNRRVEIMIR